MAHARLITGWILGCCLIAVQASWAQTDMGGGMVGNIAGDLGTANLGSGIGGGTEAIPGAVLIKLKAEVQCMNCTLEEMGMDQTPGDLYQLSHDKTHFVIKVTAASPDIIWQMLNGHKLFLYPGERPERLTQLVNESATGKHIEVTGGIAPDRSALIPVIVNVK